MGLLPIHDFVTSSVGHLSYADLSNVDVSHYVISKLQILFITSPPISLERSFKNLEAINLMEDTDFPEF